MKPLRRFGVQPQQQTPRFVLLRFIFAAALFYNRDSDPRRQLVHGYGKIDVLVIHHKAENAAAHATAKTMKSLALRTNREGRRFLLMKWTERLKTCPRSLKRKISPDHFHDVVRGRDLLDCFRRDRHFFARSRVLTVANLAREQGLTTFPQNRADPVVHRDARTSRAGARNHS